MPANQHVRLALLITLGLLVSATIAVPQAVAQSEPAVAVVDMDRVFNESAVAKSAGEQMNAAIKQVQGRLTSLQAESKNIVDELQQLAAGSERYLELTRMRTLKQAELEAEQNFGMARVQLLRLQANLQIFALARQAIADVAQQKRIGIVVKKAPQLPATATGRNAGDVETLVHQQVVLFVAPEHDITGDVLVRMDELVRSGAAAAGGNGAATQPTTTRPAGP